VFSASSEARDRNAPTNANQIRLQTSRIRQEHRPIRYQLPARLSFRQGQDLDRVFRLVSLQIGDVMIAQLLLGTRRSDLYDDRRACGQTVGLG
jgi:hypothetical protein